MKDLNLKQGDRIIVNGIRRAFHGSFRGGTILDFVRPLRSSKPTIEYCSFSNLKFNEKDGWIGNVQATHLAKCSTCSLVESGINLYAKGINIWNKNKI